MTQTVIVGIDGSEAIGFLAGVGLARLYSLEDDSTTICWMQRGGRWHPDVAGDGKRIDESVLAKTTSQFLLQLGEDREYGPAHIGDRLGVPPVRFRKHATRAINDYVAAYRNPRPDNTAGAPSLTVAALAAGANSLIRNPGKASEVAVSSLSFSNGNSGQLLLKDFRNAARKCTEEIVRGTLAGAPRLDASTTSLNWDPRDQRAAAYRWRDPAEEKSMVDPCINALAFIGMTMFSAVPNRGLRTIAWRYGSRPHGLVWPLWTRRLSIDTAQTMIHHALDPEMMNRGGTADIRFSRVTNPDGKRNYFAPARSLNPEEL